MSALTRDRATPYREGIEVDYPVATNTKIFAGSLVCVNAAGYAVPAADTTGYQFAGVAMEQVDNTGGSDGGQSVNLRRTGVFEFDAVSITQAMVCASVPMSGAGTSRSGPMTSMISAT